MKSKLLLLFALLSLTFNMVNGQTRLSVGERYQCFLEDYANKSYDWINISWTVSSGLYVNYSGTYVRTVSFQEYKSGTYSVTVNWTETDMSDPFDSFRHKSHTWYFTCDNPGPIKVTNISLNKTSASMFEWDSEPLQLTATVTPSNAADKTVTWSSDNEEVAEVSSTGRVTAKNAGNAIITCKANDGSGVKATCSVKVIWTFRPVSSITLDKTSLSLQTGQSTTLNATVKPEHASDNTVTWSSDNESVAEVSSTGKVTAKKAGKAIITCTAHDGTGISANCSVTVTDPVVEPTDIIISPYSSKTITVGETFYASYTLSPSNATTTVTWSSDDTNIATVNQAGLVTGVNAGSTSINVTTANGITDFFKITVTPSPTPVEKISLDYYFKTVELTKTSKLTYTIEPADGTPTLTWTSSNPSIASVAQDGTVTGKKQGTARITVTTDNGKSSYCDVKVVKFITAQTVEGITMTFQVLDETEKTCQAGGDPNEDRNFTLYAQWAVGYYTSGVVTIPSTADGYTVTAVSELSFFNHPNITSVIIPNTVKTIRKKAFKKCTAIETFVIPNSVTEIDSRAFCDCSMLKTVTLPNSLTILNDGLFENDTELTSIEIPSTVTKIDWYVFWNTGLKEITIPSSVTYIGWCAFGNCLNLEKVISMISDPFTINRDVFENEMDDVTSFTNATLYVPRGAKAAYEATSAWNEFTNIVEMGGLHGDVNEDEKVNGTDLVALTNIILGRSPKKPSADVSGDGDVNGADYVALANIILRKASGARQTVTGLEAIGTISTLNVKPFCISAGETKEIIVELTNPYDELTLLQFDLALPDGLSINKVGEEYEIGMGGRTTWQSHQLAAYDNDNVIRCLLASNSNALIEGKEGTAVRLTVTASNDFVGGSITLHNILGVTPTEREVWMSASQYDLSTDGVTGIYSTGMDSTNSEIFSLSGQRQTILKKGVNIVNGKKVIMK